MRCVHRKSGCEWTGELRELDRHLNLNPAELGKQLVGCEFAAIACTHCHEYFQRRHVNAHETESCPQRPFSCDHCEDYGSVYEDVVNNHWPVCKCYPVPCPNECGVSLERQNMEAHVNTVCPLTVVNCDFHYAGCEVQSVRKDMPTHLAESLVTHISLLTTQTQTLAGRGGRDTILLNLSLLALHNQQLTQLTIQQKASLEESQRKIQELEREKEAQATVNAELQKCSEASRHEVEALKKQQKNSSEVNEREIEALKRRVNNDVEQEVAGLRKQQLRSNYYGSLIFMFCLCFCFTFLFTSWKQASEIETLKLQDAALRTQLKGSLEEIQIKIQELEREQATVMAELQKSSNTSKREIEALKLKVSRDVSQEVAKLKRQQKNSLEESHRKIQKLEQKTLTGQREIEGLKMKVNQDIAQGVAELRRQLKETQNESWHKIQALEREKQAQATVNADQQKCCEASKHEIEALKQKQDLGQKVADLTERQQEKSQQKIQELEQKTQEEIEALKLKMSKDVAREVAERTKLLKENLQESQQKIQELEQKTQEEIEALKLKMSKDVAREVAERTKLLKENLQESQQKIQALKDRVALQAPYIGMCSPVTFTMINYENIKSSNKTWYSPPFYTHPQGYKMCLRVDANGDGGGKGTHVSVSAYLMRGEFDDHLKWPFRGSVVLQLCNQLEDRSHYRRTIDFSETTDSKIISRVTRGERAEQGKGPHVLIPHNFLDFNTAINCQYLRNDSLQFRIIAVESLSEPEVLPTEVVMTNFEQHKRESTTWNTPPFYTHPQGYKMWLCVYANGYGSGKGTHVSIVAYLMEGEFDDHLKWPFRGHITVTMLNQLKDNRHITETIEFTATEHKRWRQHGFDYTERVPSGWGCPTFIAHAYFNHAKNHQYLKYDCLRFRIAQ